MCKDIVGRYPKLSRKIEKQSEDDAKNITGRGQGKLAELGVSYWHVAGAETEGVQAADSPLARELLIRFMEEGLEGYIPFPNFGINFPKGKLEHAMGAGSFKIMWHQDRL